MATNTMSMHDTFLLVSCVSSTIHRPWTLHCLRVSRSMTTPKKYQKKSSKRVWNKISNKVSSKTGKTQTQNQKIFKKMQIFCTKTSHLRSRCSTRTGFVCDSQWFGSTWLAKHQLRAEELSTTHATSHRGQGGPMAYPKNIKKNMLNEETNGLGLPEFWEKWRYWSFFMFGKRPWVSKYSAQGTTNVDPLY